MLRRYLESVAEMLNNSSRWVDQLLAHAGDIDCQAAANRGVAAQLPRKIALYTAEARDIQRQACTYGQRWSWT